MSIKITSYEIFPTRFLFNLKFSFIYLSQKINFTLCGFNHNMHSEYLLDTSETNIQLYQAYPC